MDYIEFFHWSERWIMDNLPPLPLVKYVSPCYDPYEYDESYYTNQSNECYYDSHITSLDEQYYEEDNPIIYTHESESDDDTYLDHEYN